MKSMRFLFGISFAVAAMLWLPAKSSAQNPQVQEQATAKELPQPLVALADIPQGQFIVEYRNGELTIKARNAPLIDVLRAVCSQIGAELDFSSEKTDPLLAVLGPAPARQVLASLLHDLHFNYAMTESPDDPSALASVMVFPKMNDSKRQETRDSGVQHQVGQTQVSSAAAASTGSGPDRKQLMRELLAQAQAEVANSGGIVFDNHGEAGNAGDAASTAQQPDAAALLKLVEAQIGAIGDAAATDADSPQTGQPASSAGPVMPDGRSRHRKRH